MPCIPTCPHFSIPVYHAFFLLPPLLGTVLLIQHSATGIILVKTFMKVLYLRHYYYAGYPDEESFCLETVGKY